MPQSSQPWWAQSNRQTQPMPGQMNNYGFPGTSQNRPQPSFVLYGRMVEREEDIKVSDVPMDGTPGLFPLADWSAVIVKAWSNDGQIRAMRYVAEDLRAPSIPQVQEPVQQQVAPVPNPQPQQPTLTAEQVSQMIDTKIGQLVTALMSNAQQNQQVAPTPQQPPKQSKPPKKEEVQQ